MNKNIIYIGFSTTQYPLSKLIRFFTGSKVTHTWVKYYDSYLDQWMVFQASIFGIEIQLYNRFKRRVQIIKEFPLVDLEISVKSAILELGVPYDVGALFGMAFVQVMKRWFG